MGGAQQGSGEEVGIAGNKTRPLLLAVESEWNAEARVMTKCRF